MGRCLALNGGRFFFFVSRSRRIFFVFFNGNFQCLYEASACKPASRRVRGEGRGGSGITSKHARKHTQHGGGGRKAKETPILMVWLVVCVVFFYSLIHRAVDSSAPAKYLPFFMWILGRVCLCCSLWDGWGCTDAIIVFRVQSDFAVCVPSAYDRSRHPVPGRPPTTKILQHDMIRSMCLPAF